jgi:type IV pilus assembly protein PilC
MNQKAYLWHGIDQNGMRISGKMYAENIDSAKNKLIKQHISPLKIHKKFKLYKKISSKHIADFSRQLATLINSNIPLFNALNIMQQNCKHFNLRVLIENVKSNIEEGMALSDALKNQACFSKLFYNLVFIGEQSGTLDNMLNHIANYREKIEVQKHKIKKALLYPSVILLIAIIVSIVLLILVVPQFVELFNSFGAQLPIYTQFIIKLSTIIKSKGLFMLLVIIAMTFACKMVKRHCKKFAIFCDKIILKIPIIGSVLKKSIIARFCRTLAITFNAGLPLNEALQIIAETCNNQIYRQAIFKIHQQVSAGQNITSVMENNPLFPNRAVQMITIGEQSGTLDSMLVKIAEYYDAEVNYLVDNLNNLLEPSIMVILGILIGGLIIGMYLPIFKLGTVI